MKSPDRFIFYVFCFALGCLAAYWGHAFYLEVISA